MHLFISRAPNKGEEYKKQSLVPRPGCTAILAACPRAPLQLGYLRKIREQEWLHPRELIIGVEQIKIAMQTKKSVLAKWVMSRNGIHENRQACPRPQEKGCEGREGTAAAAARHRLRLWQWKAPPQLSWSLLWRTRPCTCIPCLRSSAPEVSALFCRVKAPPHWALRASPALRVRPGRQAASNPPRRRRTPPKVGRQAN